MWLGTIWLGIVAFISLVALAPVFDMTISISVLAAACLGSVLAGISGATLALFIGATTGRSGLAAAITGAVVAGTYVGASLGAHAFSRRDLKLN